MSSAPDDDPIAADEGAAEPVDTLEAPHEPVVVTRSTVSVWALTLVGPVVWIVHFAFVYLTAEATCEGLRSDEMHFLGEDALRRLIVVATAAGAAMCLASAALAWRRRGRRDHGAMMIVGTMLALGSAASVLAVGLPVLALGPC